VKTGQPKPQGELSIINVDETREDGSLKLPLWNEEEMAQEFFRFEEPFEDPDGLPALPPITADRCVNWTRPSEFAWKPTPLAVKPLYENPLHKAVPCVVKRPWGLAMPIVDPNEYLSTEPAPEDPKAKKAPAKGAPVPDEKPATAKPKLKFSVPPDEIEVPDFVPARPLLVAPVPYKPAAKPAIIENGEAETEESQPPRLEEEPAAVGEAEENQQEPGQISALEEEHDPPQWLEEDCELQKLISALVLLNQHDVDSMYIAGSRPGYLWSRIYPKDPDGFPMFNPSGKYAVKLYVVGAWRKVVVDDRMPVDSKGVPLLPQSIEGAEIWPLILSKALLKVTNGRFTGNSPESMAMEESVGFYAHTLSGYIPEFQKLQNVDVAEMVTQHLRVASRIVSVLAPRQWSVEAHPDQQTPLSTFVMGKDGWGESGATPSSTGWGRASGRRDSSLSSRDGHGPMGGSRKRRGSNASSIASELEPSSISKRQSTIAMMAPGQELSSLSQHGHDAADDDEYDPLAPAYVSPDAILPIAVCAFRKQQGVAQIGLKPQEVQWDQITVKLDSGTPPPVELSDYSASEVGSDDGAGNTAGTEAAMGDDDTTRRLAEEAAKREEIIRTAKGEPMSWVTLDKILENVASVLVLHRHEFIAHNVAIEQQKEDSKPPTPDADPKAKGKPAETEEKPIDVWQGILPYVLEVKNELDATATVCMLMTTQETMGTFRVEKAEYESPSDWKLKHILETACDRIGSVTLHVPSGLHYYRIFLPGHGKNCHVSFHGDQQLRVGDEKPMLENQSLIITDFDGAYGDEEPLRAFDYHILFKLSFGVPEEGLTISPQLYLTDSTVADSIRMWCVDRKSGIATPILGISAGAIMLAPNDAGYMLVCECLPHMELAAGKWKLRLVSSAQPVEPSIGTVFLYEDSMDLYQPNFHFQLFRFKIELPSEQPCSISAHCNTFTPAKIRLSLVEKSGVEPEASEHTIIDVSANTFCTLPEVLLSPPDDPSKKLILVGTVLSYEILPRSAPQETPTESEEPAEIIEYDTPYWTCRIASSIQLTVSEDLEREEAHAAMKAKWEAKEAGRAERAKQSRNDFGDILSGKAAEVVAEEEGAEPPPPAEDEIKKDERGNVLGHPPEKTLRVAKLTQSNNGSKKLLSSEDLEARTASHAEVLEKFESKRTSISEKREAKKEERIEQLNAAETELEGLKTGPEADPEFEQQRLAYIELAEKEEAERNAALGIVPEEPKAGKKK
jgi:hypothetical protein